MNRLICLGLAGCAAFSASAGAGYLAVIGPAPLRFESRARPPAHARALLPLLLMQDPAPPAAATNAFSPPAFTNAPAEILAPPVVTNLPVVTTVTMTNPPPIVVLPGPLPQPSGPLLGPWMDPNDPNSLLTAQMLIHYFRPLGTNAPGAVVATPLFIPPRPATPPSSTVRYTTP